MIYLIADDTNISMTENPLKSVIEHELIINSEMKNVHQWLKIVSINFD